MKRRARYTRKVKEPKFTFLRKTVQLFGNVAGIYESQKGHEFFGWHTKIHGLMGDISTRVVPIKTLRLTALRACTIAAVEAVEKNELSQADLEIVLDYLFAELNKRLNKEAKVKDAA